MDTIPKLFPSNAQNFLVIYFVSIHLFATLMLMPILIFSQMMVDCNYIDKWAAPMMQLKIYSCLMLRSVSVWRDVEAAMYKLNEQKLYDATNNSTQLHKELGFVINYCSESKIRQWKNENIPTTKRRVEVFTHLDTENCDYMEMSKIIEYILCLPGSTASAERVFAAMNKTWTAEKTQLKVDTLKAILTIKVNLKISCLEFYSFIKSQPNMLRQISSKSKYNVRGDEQMDDEDDEDDFGGMLLE